jgi:hypothetical protein
MVIHNGGNQVAGVVVAVVVVGFRRYALHSSDVGSAHHPPE